MLYLSGDTLEHCCLEVQDTQQYKWNIQTSSERIYHHFLAAPVSKCYK